MSSRFFIQRYVCEMFWALALAADVILHSRLRPRQDIHMQTSPLHAARAREVRRQQALRKLLRLFPYWILGHIRLGESELELGRFSDEPLPARARASIRLSAQAAKQLLNEFHQPPNGRAALEAEFLFASLDFSDRKFAEAAERYSRLLAPENAVQLHREIQKRAAENVGVCASVLGSA